MTGYKGLAPIAELRSSIEIYLGTVILITVPTGKGKGVVMVKSY